MNQHIAMPHISVESPVTHNSWEDGKFITYDIIVNCEDDSCPLFALPRSLASRRYSEFRWLRKRLCAVPSATIRRVPPLPTVGCPLFDDRFSPEFIERRRRGLEEFLQGVCAIPTLLSEASLHLFLQTDLSIIEIEGYVDRKWGRREEVYDVVVSLNQQKQCEERDEIASLASAGRWSEASLLDLEDDALSNDSPSLLSSSANKNSACGGSSNVGYATSPPQASAGDNSVISPVLGLYLPPENNSVENRSVPDRSGEVNDRIGHTAAPGTSANRRRRSRSVQIRVPNDNATSAPSASSSYSSRNHNQVSSSLSPENAIEEENGLRVPSSVDIFNRRRSGRLNPTAAGKNLPYYCSNAVWLASNGGGGANTASPAPRVLSPAIAVSMGSQGMSPMSSSSLGSNGGSASTNALP